MPILLRLPASGVFERRIRCRPPSCIDDYSGTISSPAERDFAMLNLLICGNPPEADLRPRQSLN